MTLHGLRDQDRLDGASNYVIWKTKILAVLEDNDLEAYINSVIAIFANNNQKKKYKAREMWEALSSLYEGSFEQRKMYLE